MWLCNYKNKCWSMEMRRWGDESGWGHVTQAAARKEEFSESGGILAATELPTGSLPPGG